MVFSTPFFLFFYLPIVLLLHYITPLKWRNGILLLINLVFYGWGEPIYILIMFLSIAIDYTHGLLVDRAKKAGKDGQARAAVASSVVFNLGLLFFFKYWDFFAASFASIGLDFMPTLGLSLPIGISFYTFQTMSYTIDVYRGDAAVQKNIVNFGTFVTLFPQLIAGPILKYKELGDQIDQRDYPVERFASGVQIFVVGLAKKVLIANSLGQLWDIYLATPTSELSVVGAWLGTIAFGIQIYFDFSGYSDMAVGLGRMLGFQFSGNFNYPYIAKSVSDFWRRWHISLGSWFREYLYIPLGGNRVSQKRICLNLMLVWGVTGFWHGASWNFLIWGLYFGVLIVMERLFLGDLLKKCPSFVQHGYALVIVLISWALFAIEDFGQMLPYLAAMFGGGEGGFIDSDTLYYIGSYGTSILVAFVAATPVGKHLWHKLPEKVTAVLMPILLVAGLVLSTAYLVDATYNPFLYFRF